MENPSTPRFVLSQCITARTIELQMRGVDRDEVLRELVEKIPALAPRPESRQTLVRALQEREQLCSTGIGDGIALPHARNALVGMVDQTVIVFGRHPTGVPFGAIDNVPARLFFLLVAPTVNQHLQVLARLSRVLREPKLRQNLLLAERPDKVIALIREAETTF